ncbi:MAG: putative Ig domain-containing protein, partial [Synergistaceae bacterium]|nr:putative Ig domain-containing protein [Synergistaceae bacterium]
VSAFVSNNVSSDLTLTLTVNPSDEDSSDKAVNIITSYLPLGEIGKEYSARLEANPSGASWTLAGDTLPTGLTLNADGTISGIPTQTGSFIFRVKASYPSYTDGEIQLTISVTQDNGGYSVIIGSSGGGCDSGMGTATLLLSFMAVIAKRKR